LWACHSALTEKPGVSHAGLQEHWNHAIAIAYLFLQRL
jgi:hypothetical protein